MGKKITSFLPDSDTESLNSTVKSLKDTGVVAGIFIVTGNGSHPEIREPEIKYLNTDGFASTDSVKKMADAAATDYVLVYSKSSPLDLGKFALNRMMQVCENMDAGIVYSDYFENKNNQLSPHPVIDYQEGSLRDDFNFGSVILYKASAFRDACKKMESEFRFAGLYDLRLKISQEHAIVHLARNAVHRNRTRYAKIRRKAVRLCRSEEQGGPDRDGKSLHRSSEKNQRLAET